MMAGEGGEKLFLELVEVFVGLGVVLGEERLGAAALAGAGGGDGLDSGALGAPGGRWIFGRWRIVVGDVGAELLLFVEGALEAQEGVGQTSFVALHEDETVALVVGESLGEEFAGGDPAVALTLHCGVALGVEFQEFGGEEVGLGFGQAI